MRTAHLTDHSLRGSENLVVSEFRRDCGGNVAFFPSLVPWPKDAGLIRSSGRRFRSVLAFSLGAAAIF